MKSNTNPAFTIVELLVVIVVIGILAAISIVAYTGISQKAVSASLQSDLSNASTMLKNFQVDNSTYPTIISTDCVSFPDTTTRKCLKASPGTTYNYIPGSISGSSYQSFTLTATNPSLSYSYVITEASKPTALAPAPLSPIADWLATTQGDHYGNYYDLVGKSWATVTRAGTKTIYDPTAQRIFDVPANYLGIAPRSDGKSGVEATIEETRTNNVLQSSFENTMNGWNYQYVANGSAVSSSEKSVYGSNSLKITRTQAVTEANVYNSLSGLTPSTMYAYSVYAWASQPNSACIFTYIATTDTPLTCHSGNSTWQRLTGTFVSSATGTIQLRLGDIGPGPITSAYYDAVQVELGSFATSYIPTTAVAVTRNADVVSIPTTNWNANAGTIVVLAKQNTANQSGQGYNYRSLLDVEPSPYYYFMRTNVWGGLENYFSIDGVAGYTFNPTADVYWTSSMSWTVNNLRSYLNGTLAATDSSLTIPGSLPGQIYVGSGGGGTCLNGSIPHFIIYSSQLSDADVTTVTNSIKDGP